jgi:hypothetical protein
MALNTVMLSVENKTIVRIVVTQTPDLSEMLDLAGKALKVQTD